MALTVATNTGALMAQAAASSVNKEMEISMERLATGKRINGASDDAAGVAIASRLTSEINGTNQAIRNAMDAQAFIDTAEGAHQEVETLLQRMRELAVQSANDTNDANDRANLQTEFDSLVDEIDRISTVTTWAGQNILDGSGGVSSDGAFSFHVGSGNTDGSDNVSVSINSVASTSATLTASGATLASYKASASAGSVPHIKIDLFQDTDNTVAADGFAITNGDTDNATNMLNSDGELFITTTTDTADLGHATITINGDDTDNDVTLTVDLSTSTTTEEIADEIFAALNANQVLQGVDIDSAAADAGKLTLTSASNSTGSGGLATSSDARTVIGALDTMIQAINGQRAVLGSMSNRLDSTVSNLTNVSSNLQAGRGRIEDADFAAETTSLAKSQILQQASTAMLAQANASKQNVLSLLQG